MPEGKLLLDYFAWWIGCGGRADSFWSVFEFSNSLVATQEMVKELNGSDIELPDNIRVI